MSTVYIHAGTPKTGSTALQDFLPDNESVLNRHGFSFPEVPLYFRGVAPHQTAHFLAMWEPDGNVPESWDEGFRIVQEALQRHENVIISDEQVWWRQHKEGFWEEVTKRFAGMGADIKVVVYLRRQDDQVESFYNEKVKGMPKLVLTFSEYLSEGWNDYFPLDYDKELDRFASYLGQDNVIVRVYEKGHFAGGNIFADFLDAIGLSLTDEYVLPERHANTRWPERIVEIKRMVNASASYHRRRVPNFYRNAIEEAYGIGTAKEFPQQEYGMFSSEERASFMKKFEAGNAYVAKKYLGRDDGILFSEAARDLPQWQPDESELIEDAVRVMAGADVYLYKGLAELEQQMTEIYDSKPYQLFLRLREKRRQKRQVKED